MTVDSAATLVDCPTQLICTSICMESPPPAVFHDKAKRTQQGDLLEKLPKLTQNIDPFPVLPTLLFRSSDLPKVGRRG